VTLDADRLINVGTLLCVAASAVFVGFQTRFAAHQTRALRTQVTHMTKETSIAAAAARASVYQGIAGQMLEIDRFLFEQPSFRRYLYGETTPPTMSLEQQSRLETVTEMFVDFADNVYIQAKNLQEESVYPGQADLWDSWAGYFHDVYEKSAVVKEFVAKRRDWYESGLCQVLEEGRMPTNRPGVS